MSNGNSSATTPQAEPPRTGNAWAYARAQEIGYAMFYHTATLFWLFVLCLAIFIFLIRIIIAQTSDLSGESTVEILVLVSCIYLLFLLEGLQHCAIQINDADTDGISDVVSRNVGRRKLRRTDFMVTRFRSDLYFEQFLTGRNMCSMILIVMIAFILDKMPFAGPDKNMFYSFIDSHSYWPTAHIAIDPVLHSFVIVFLLSTLLPCWIAQLLPQLLAGKHSVEFIQMPGARVATWIAISVAQLETGRPSEFLHAGVRRIFGAFTEPEIFPPGQAAMFERQAASFGMSVEERSIKIEAHTDKLTIEDRSSLAYRGEGVSTIRHSLRIAPPSDGTVTLDDWDFEFPSWIATHDRPQASCSP